MVDDEEMISAPKDISGCSNLTTFRDFLCIEVLLYLIWLVRHHGDIRMRAEWNSGAGETLTLMFLVGL